MGPDRAVTALIELGESPPTCRRQISKRNRLEASGRVPHSELKMMSESGGVGDIGMVASGVTSSEGDRILNQDNRTAPWSTTPAPIATRAGSEVRTAGDKKDATWVKFEEDETGEGAATIQPSSIEVVATKTLQQQAIAKDPNQLGRAVLEKAKNGTNSTNKDHSEIRIEPFEFRPSPPRSPVITELAGGVAMAGSNVSTRTNSEDKFVNGDIICTVLPSNKSCAWVTRAKFPPNLVPEEIMDTSLTITVEDYVLALQILTNDVRFTLYNVLYKRVLLLWMFTGFVILLSLLFSGTRGLALFGGGVFWLIVNAVGIFAFMYIKLKVGRSSERGDRRWR
ncbi:hypothetical protein BIW11_07840 [Tropilaelaps mercedesae]|uniref:Uncharacterized protein n=1 Tax=Tropilaelaps mercedesae TaxID=418985 RepID=A0A1V9XSG0_9ACAR|nr:hypothetical protein BIW11_07840 [Tropilaelaps mercedesae]